MQGDERQAGSATVDTFFTILLVVIFLLVVWFAGFVAVRLFKGQGR
jgi:flagellar biogenesis protein FliO